ESLLVERLRADGSGLFVIVAEIEAGFIGAAAFTPMAIAGERSYTAAALGPIATAPKFRGRGVGAGLVRAGLAQCRRRSVGAVFVLGAPSFYGRFGFTAAAAAKVASPWAGSHFQALSLTDGVELFEGEARYPEPFYEMFSDEEDGV
nr:N-acetyltransferase [Paracoccaceae bacterium]